MYSKYLVFFSELFHYKFNFEFSFFFWTIIICALDIESNGNSIANDLSIQTAFVDIHYGSQNNHEYIHIIIYSLYVYSHRI